VMTYRGASSAFQVLVPELRKPVERAWRSWSGPSRATHQARFQLGSIAARGRTVVIMVRRASHELVRKGAVMEGAMGDLARSCLGSPCAAGRAFRHPFPRGVSTRAAAGEIGGYSDSCERV